jgi:hypothetical protein
MGYSLEDVADLDAVQNPAALEHLARLAKELDLYNQ